MIFLSPLRWTSIEGKKWNEHSISSKWGVPHTPIFLLGAVARALP